MGYHKDVKKTTNKTTYIVTGFLCTKVIEWLLGGLLALPLLYLDFYMNAVGLDSLSYISHFALLMSVAAFAAFVGARFIAKRYYSPSSPLFTALWFTALRFVFSMHIFFLFPSFLFSPGSGGVAQYLEAVAMLFVSPFVFLPALVYGIVGYLTLRHFESSLEQGQLLE